jgi:hypothetical protein
MVQRDLDRHIVARRAYGQALARVTAIEDGNAGTTKAAAIEFAAAHIVKKFRVKYPK